MPPSVASAGCARLLDQQVLLRLVQRERDRAADARLGLALWNGGDQVLIDGGLVNGSAATVGWFGGLMRRVQSGYLYAYAFWMMIGLALLLGWFLFRAHN